MPDIDLFAGIAVSDFGRAVGWFERLFGAPPSFAPHDTERVWIISEHRSIYVVLRPERAGYAIVTLLLDDLDGFVAEARQRGVEPDAVEEYANGVRKVTFRDPDGNEIAFGAVPAER
jgi:catechol 2,3-dioxygenase-like lactoylglutathione lyase family enzyme